MANATAPRRLLDVRVHAKGVETLMLQAASLTRKVRLFVPQGYDGKTRLPLVLNLHGYSQDGLQQSSISKMLAASDANGFIVLHPDGHHSPRGWNAGVCCGAAATSGTDDVAIVSVTQVDQRCGHDLFERQALANDAADLPGDPFEWHAVTHGASQRAGR